MVEGPSTRNIASYVRGDKHTQPLGPTRIRADTRAHRQTTTHVHTHEDTHTQTCTYTQTHRHTDRATDRDTHTHTQRHKYRYTCTHKLRLRRKRGYEHPRPGRRSPPNATSAAKHNFDVTFPRGKVTGEVFKIKSKINLS